MPQAIVSMHGGTNMVQVVRANLAIGGGSNAGPVLEVEQATPAQIATLSAQQKVEQARSEQARAHGLGSRLLNAVG